MKTYKLFRIRDGDLYPLYVEAGRKVRQGVWEEARVGRLTPDGRHVYGRTGLLSARPGWHSTEVPFTDWIGRKGADGRLYQWCGTAWTECEVDGGQIIVTDRYGLRTVPDGWYYFRTNPKQDRPWIISGRIKVIRILTHDEVAEICGEHGIRAQPMAEE
ncbi:MAG: hypothetical protein IJV04_08565 [Lachnospiraceae bacterium]|nr:hypothetical protein [Lachnospiraceae bacterium]